jgi:hypothetical protein
LQDAVVTKDAKVAAPVTNLLDGLGIEVRAEGHGQYDEHSAIDPLAGFVMVYNSRVLYSIQ